jgi:hypothetical protein
MWQQVQEDGIESSDEALCLVEDSQFDGDKAGSPEMCRR